VADASTLALRAGVAFQAAKTVVVKRTGAAVMNFIFFYEDRIDSSIISHELISTRYTLEPKKKLWRAQRSLEVTVN
jgi:hypothetical protein